MSLDFSLTRVQPTQVFSRNITHNLNEMAMAAGIYQCLWRPEEEGITKAHQMIEPLSQGLARLCKLPEAYKHYESPNGWGTYNGLVAFAKEVLAACIEYPDADVEVSR